MCTRLASWVVVSSLSLGTPGAVAQPTYEVTDLGVFRFPEGVLTLTELLGAESVDEVRARTAAQFAVSL